MPVSLNYQLISTSSQLERFCERAQRAATIGFDTEFVSEDRYRPELCLVQAAIPGELVVIDPLAIRDLQPFWERVASGDHRTLVHAGRQEVKFCFEATGKCPTGLFDMQIAAGMVGCEYPAAYSTLIQRLQGQSLGKGETRTDWRRRPLSPRQLDYAVRDVLYLEPLYNTLISRLEKMGRLEWFWQEMADWQSRVVQSDHGERWRRMPGISGFSHRALAIVRELWLWRDAEAKRQDRPPRRILRDDLIAELAKRGTADVASVRSIRGVNYRDKKRYLDAISEGIGRALELPEKELPRPARRKTGRPRLMLLGQFLATALNSVCHAQQVAPGLVGTVEDVRDLIAYHLRLENSEGDTPPPLAAGWRAEIVGNTIQEVLAGNLAIRVGDPLADHPLCFERNGQSFSAQASLD